MTIIAILLSLAAPVLALDQKALLEHVRESYNIPGELEITMSAPKPSEISGFKMAELVISKGGVEQKEKLYLSDNGRFYQLGEFKDASKHPDRERMEKIDLSGSAVRGPKNAPVSVVEYTDFQCFFCEKGFKTMMEIMKEYGNKVKWVYKSLPLTSIHPWAEPAAVAAECAKLQGEDKFWKVHDAFFNHQSSVTVSNFEKMSSRFVADAGADIKKFLGCYQNEETLKIVRRDMQEAAELSISGTPAFLVNGHLVGGADGKTLRRIIEESLQGKHGGSK